MEHIYGRRRVIIKSVLLVLYFDSIFFSCTRLQKTKFKNFWANPLILLHSASISLTKTRWESSLEHCSRGSYSRRRTRTFATSDIRGVACLPEPLLSFFLSSSEDRYIEQNRRLGHHKVSTLFVRSNATRKAQRRCFASAPEITFEFSFLRDKKFNVVYIRA